MIKKAEERESLYTGPWSDEKAKLRSAMWTNYIDALYGGDVPCADGDVYDWVDENIGIEGIFNDRQDVIDDLSGQIKLLNDRLESLKGPDGIIRTFTVDPSCDFGDVDEG